MIKRNTLIVVAIWIVMGVWLALEGQIGIVIFLIAAAVLSVAMLFGIGYLLCKIDDIREKRKNKKPN
jgi:ABC-type Na+ efflux pump permease subunit